VVTLDPDHGLFIQYHIQVSQKWLHG